MNYGTRQSRRHSHVVVITVVACLAASSVIGISFLLRTYGRETGHAGFKRGDVPASSAVEILGVSIAKLPEATRAVSTSPQLTAPTVTSSPQSGSPSAHVSHTSPVKASPGVSPSAVSPSAVSPSAVSSPLGSSLANLDVSVSLTGSTAVAWGDDALDALGAPTTTANVQTMVDWFANEGTPHDLNNPLNLQTPYGGSVVSTAGGSPAADQIQAYPTPADFVAAFPLEMNNGSYPAIVAALKAGQGLEGSAASSEISSELSVYSGGGYNSIPGRA